MIRQYVNSEFLNSDLPVLDALAIPGLKIETGGTRRGWGRPAQNQVQFITDGT